MKARSVRTGRAGGAAAGRVYVVDDDESVRRGLARLLGVSGYGCEVFASAAEYLAAPVAAGTVGCLILDIRMPEMTGVELQRRVSGLAHDLPIIFLTGHADIPTCVETLKAGAVSFLTKPFEPGELMAAVEEAFARSRERVAAHAAREAVRARFEKLSLREREVFDGVVRGLLNKQIAAGMGIAEKTVKVHRGRVMDKMRVDSVAELVRVSVLLGAATKQDGVRGHG